MNRLLAATLILLAGVAAGPATQPVTVPIGRAYAATAVNAAVFRVSSVVTAQNYQFTTYYDPAGHIVVARRSLDGATWDFATLASTGNVRDAHNVAVLGVSGDGILHLCYDQHDQPLHYRVSANPYDVHSFSAGKSMTGQDEQRVTYPQFVAAPNGSLYFFYRDGASGNGSLCLNRYDSATHSWQPLQHPLIDGEGKCNPYWSRPAIGPDGAIHLAWCWRDTPNAETNHDLCYAQSTDGGRTWLTSGGAAQPLPITPENAEVVAPIAKGSNLINQCSAAVDPSGHPHFAEYFNDPAGVPQYFHLWFDGAHWHTNQVSHRTRGFSLSGGGSLAIPISRPEIAISRGGTVYLITRDAEFGGGVRLYTSVEPFTDWRIIDLPTGDLGNWEPTYDLSRWAATNVLDLFLLPVRQGNHERATDMAPQTAAILETPLR